MTVSRHVDPKAASMRKVVINGCYGGFGLSPKATEAFAARKGVEKLYWFVNVRKPDGGIDFDEYELTDTPASVFVAFAFTTPEPPKRGDDEDWKSRYFARQEIARDDPDLVAVVEKLGSAANGAHADLKVVEIPADVGWEIEEYDGIEWVSERHRRWS